MEKLLSKSFPTLESALHLLFDRYRNPILKPFLKGLLRAYM